MALEVKGEQEDQLGKQMSFLEHLDEVRRRLINCILIIALVFGVCWFAHREIYNFLAIPVQRALGEAQRREIPVEGLTGNEKILPLGNLQEGETGLYVFDQATKLGGSVVAPGTSVHSVVSKDNNEKIGLFTDEPIYTSNAIIPKGVRLPLDFNAANVDEPSADERMIVTTAMEPFTLYVTVSLYASIALSMPFLLWQVWGFISPALYKHERAYVTPFIALSSISFIIGAAFAYYVLVPPALNYLLGLGGDFRLLLRATDYFDFITIVMLAMGIIFQMPAITYVLARIGIVSAGFLLKSWKFAIIIILIVAAVVSPTGDIPNMMLFAAPMMFLYLISIFVAWFFGRKRKSAKV
jgi:sec-independent protein translocase protein TatC